MSDALAVAHEVAHARGAVGGPSPVLDVAALTAALDAGTHRAGLMRDYSIAQTDAIAGSPTFMLPDGSTVTNPGIEVHREGEWAAGFPVVDSHDPSVYADLCAGTPACRRHAFPGGTGVDGMAAVRTAA